MAILPFYKAVSPKKLSFLALACLVVLSLYRFECLWRQPASAHVKQYGDVPAPLTMGIANKVYVITLAKREARRRDMEALRRALHLQWTYVDAMDAASPLTNSLLHWVSKVRSGPPFIINEGSRKESFLPPETMISFQWPQNLDSLASSDQEITLWDDDTWPVPALVSDPLNHTPLVCATDNYNIAEYSTALPNFLVLTPARVACWHSHLSVIQKHANTSPSGSTNVAVILEDDVDMEMDIQQQLISLWPILPSDWDIVFLGYCWSNETRYPPLDVRVQFPMTALQPPPSPEYHIHRSNSPKCTHAYALSRTGARRLLLHLRYPPFAYSRAIDQAIAWLIESGRLKGFSIIPSLVIQRKIAESDISQGTGSGWKDSLRHGYFQDPINTDPN